MRSTIAEPPFPTTPASTERPFILVFAAVAAIKLFFAITVPLTSDEAYFVVWGRFPDYGYYDHGAMTGWWVGLSLLAGQSTLMLRLPAVITPLLGALLIRGVLRHGNQGSANLAATLYLLSPVSLFNVLITADTPLLLFSLLAGAFAIRATRSERLVEWMLAGFFLGLAFLTKYFAVLLGVAFALFLLRYGGRRRYLSISALAVGACPGVAVNVIWNVNHGWTNILFNAVTRNTKAQLSLGPPLLLVLFIVIALVGPVIAYFLLRRSSEGRRSWREAWTFMDRSGTRVAVFALAVPATVFLGLSFVRPVGLHWLFSFHPFFFLVLAAKFDLRALERQIRPSIVYVAGLSALMTGLLALPTEAARWHRSYNSLVLGKHPEEVLAELRPFRDEFTLVTPSYAQSAQLGFHSGRHVPVIGYGSPHGRQDDFITDFRDFEGRNLMVVSTRPKDAMATEVLFESAETRFIEVRGARIALTLGRGFKFATYREAVLRRVAEEYYRLPAWLAKWARPAPFIERYGLESLAMPE